MAIGAFKELGLGFVISTKDKFILIPALYFHGSIVASQSFNRHTIGGLLIKA
jgi:hypothetical protein